MALLGAYHGINPGMGWLFAVALGYQEGTGRAVWRALIPIGLGHGLAIAVFVLAVAAAGAALPAGIIGAAVGAALILFGLHRLALGRHPRWVGMRVGAGRLTLWSFLMASAHGAGLMVVPLFLGLPADSAGHGHEAHGAAHQLADPLAWTVGVAIHTASHLAVTGIVAWLVYTRLGLGLLRRAWINLDLVWALALIGTGILALLLSPPVTFGAGIA